MPSPTLTLETSAKGFFYLRSSFPSPEDCSDVTSDWSFEDKGIVALHANDGCIWFVFKAELMYSTNTLGACCLRRF